MPNIIPAVAFHLPPENPTTVVTTVPEDWFEKLPDLVFGFIELTPTEQQTFKTGSQRHAGPESTYSQKKVLLDALQVIYEKLNDPTIERGEKATIAAKLNEDIRECTPGWHVRVCQIIEELRATKTLSDIAALYRQELTTMVASQHVAEVSQGSQIHFYNDVFRIAKAFGVRSLFSEDIYHGDVSDAIILDFLSKAFEERYQFFQMIAYVKEHLQTQLTKAGYDGKKEETSAYTLATCQKFMDVLAVTFVDDPDMIEYRQKKAELHNIEQVKASAVGAEFELAKQQLSTLIHPKTLEAVLDEAKLTDDDLRRELQDLGTSGSIQQLFFEFDPKFSEQFTQIRQNYQNKIQKIEDDNRAMIAELEEALRTMQERFLCYADANKYFPIDLNWPIIMQRLFHEFQKLNHFTFTTEEERLLEKIFDPDTPLDVLEATLSTDGEQLKKLFKIPKEFIHFITAYGDRVTAEKRDCLFLHYFNLQHNPKRLELLILASEQERDKILNEVRHTEFKTWLEEHITQMMLSNVNDTEYYHFYLWYFPKLSVAKRKAILIQKDSNNDNTLMRAVRYQPAVVKPLLQTIGSLDPATQVEILTQKSSDNWNILMRAACHQPLAVKPLLESIGALDTATQVEILTQKTSDHWDALMLAARYHPLAVKPLLQTIGSLDPATQVEIFTQKTGGLNALMLAIHYQPLAIKPLLQTIGALDAAAQLEIFSQKNSKNENVLMHAVRYQPAAVKPLLQTIGALDPATQLKILSQKGPYNSNILMLAARNQSAVVEPLLGAIEVLDPDTQLKMLTQEGSDKLDALMLAVHYEPFAIKPLLEAIGALDPDTQLKMLTQKGPDNLNVLMLAIHLYPDAVEPLLEIIKTLDPTTQLKIFTQKDSNHCNALMLAAYHNPDAINSLLQVIQELPEKTKKSILTQKDSNHLTVLLLATMEQPDVLKPLLEVIQELEPKAQKSILTQKDSNHLNILMLAAIDQPDAIEPLLEAIGTLDATTQLEMFTQKYHKQDALQLAIDHQPFTVKPLIHHLLQIISSMTDKKRDQIYNKYLTIIPDGEYREYFILKREEMERIRFLTELRTKTHTVLATTTSGLEQVLLQYKNDTRSFAEAVATLKHNWNTVLDENRIAPHHVKCRARFFTSSPLEMVSHHQTRLRQLK